MGTRLEPMNVSFMNLETGETTPIETKAIEIDFSDSKDYVSVNTFRRSVDGTFKVTKMDKFIMFKMLYKCNRDCKYFKRKYKYYKRCKNRKLLHAKRR